MKQQRNGFVLPLVVVSGTILLLVLGFVMRTLSVNQQSLINQHMQLLARQAAESGLARAQQCLQANNQVTTWSATRPLKPETDCTGVTNTSYGKYVVENSIYKSTFSVVPSDMQDSFRNISSVGKVEMFRADTGVKIREYQQTTSVYIQTGLTFEDIAFGSVYGYGTNLYTGTKTAKQEGVYFFTKTLAGTINGVGSNIDDVLTGYYSGDGPAKLYCQEYYYPYGWWGEKQCKRWAEIAPAQGYPYHPYGIKVEFSTGTKVKKIFTDFQGVGWNAYFLTYDNQIYVTGVNGNAMMANGINSSTSTTSNPIWGTPEADYTNSQTKVKIPGGVVVDKVITNGSTAYILTDKKRLYGFGRNWNTGGTVRGLVGCYENCNRGENEYVNAPAKVQVRDRNGSLYAYDSNRQFDVVYSDSMYTATETVTCAIDIGGRVYCWGNNEKRQIGPNAKSYYNGKCYSDCYMSVGTRVGDFGSGSTVGRAVDVKTDGQTVYILSESGKVYARGDNAYGQTGRSNCSECDLQQITNFPSGTKIVKMAVDAYSALFLSENGNVYGLGLNDAGQLGTGSIAERVSVPTLYKLPSGKKAVDIFIASPGVRKTGTCKTEEQFMCDAVRYRNSMVITEDGSVYSAGSNYYGQLGVGSIGGFDAVLDADYYSDSNSDVNRARRGIGNDAYFEVSTPVRMYLVEKDQLTGQMVRVTAKAVRSGLGMSIVITNKNRVFTVGHNHNGQLGSGDTNDRSVPEAHRLTNQWNVWYY